MDEARKALHALNPEVQVVALQKKLLDADLDRAVADCGIVLDCSDNFATRHAVNRSCVKHRTPLVSGGQADLTLEDAAALAPSFLVASPFMANVPVKGGVLVPGLAGSILMSFGTNALGNVALPFIPGGFGDFDVYAQFAIKDAAQVQGWSFSNALRIEFAP